MPVNGKLTYYEFFKLENFESDPKKIKNAYRSAALKYHPDRNEDKAGAETMMKRINEMYSVLTKEKFRYDSYLRARMGKPNKAPSSGLGSLLDDDMAVFEAVMEEALRRQRAEAFHDMHKSAAFKWKFSNGATFYFNEYGNFNSTTNTG